MKIQNIRRSDWFILKTTTFKLKKCSHCNSFQKLKTDIQLKLKSGRIVSLPHSFEIVTIRNGEIIFEKIEKIKKGDIIAAPRRLPNDNYYQKLNNITPLENRITTVPRLPSTLMKILHTFLD